MKHISLAAFILFTSIAGACVAMPHNALDSSGKPDMGKGAPQQVSDAPVAQADTQEAKDIAAVEAYLSGINSIVANFTQASADGSTGTGKFFLKRPGKMRWQYNPPTPILLVSDGKVVTYYDAGLDQVTYIGVDDTLAGFLAKKDITLNGDSTTVTKYAHENGIISIRIVQTNKPQDGSLTLEFSDKPLELKNMIAVDATGNATTVKLADAQFGPVLDDKLFVFEDPRGVNHRRNKQSH
jgi:chaperone LolA